MSAMNCEWRGLEIPKLVFYVFVLKQFTRDFYKVFLGFIHLVRTQNFLKN